MSSKKVGWDKKGEHSSFKAWEQVGKICLWRFKGLGRLKNERMRKNEYHLTADMDGCRSLMELCILLKEAQSGTRLVTLTKKPDRTGGFTYDSVDFDSARITLVAGTEDVVHITEVVNSCIVELSVSALDELALGCDDMRHGDGDWCIGELQEKQLWFWPYPGASYLRPSRG